LKFIAGQANLESSSISKAQKVVERLELLLSQFISFGSLGDQSFETIARDILKSTRIKLNERIGAKQRAIDTLCNRSLNIKGYGVIFSTS
jgi:hypothetical protein